MASSCGVKPGFLNATRWARKANRFPRPVSGETRRPAGRGLAPRGDGLCVSRVRDRVRYRTPSINGLLTPRDRRAGSKQEMFGTDPSIGPDRCLAGLGGTPI